MLISQPGTHLHLKRVLVVQDKWIIGYNFCFGFELLGNARVVIFPKIIINLQLVPLHQPKRGFSCFTTKGPLWIITVSVMNYNKLLGKARVIVFPKIVLNSQLVPLHQPKIGFSWFTKG